MAQRRRRFLSEISEAVGLPRTAQRIMEALARTRATLSVPQIPERIRASERAVRQNVGLLLRRGFLDRRSIVTPGRKFAYSYSLRSVEVILAAARRDFRRTVRRLEAFAGHLGSAHA